MRHPLLRTARPAHRGGGRSVASRAGSAERPLLVLGLALVLAVGLAATPAAATTTRATPTGARAEWVWTRPAPRALVDRATRLGVGELFVAVPPQLSSSPDLAWAREVSRRAHRAGVRVAALGGDPGWVDDPAAAAAWARDAAGTGLFDGLHVDVEPWVRADWSTDRPRVVAGYLEALRRVRAASPLRLEADVAFWLGTVAAPDGRPLDDAVADLVDALTVMSYRTTATGPDSITDVAAPAVATATARGLPVRLAVETHDLRPDPDWRKQTFFGWRRADMAVVLADVDRAMAGRPAYAGVAVEDDAGWAALSP